MATDHTDGAPPKRGSTNFVNIGCTMNKSEALRMMAATNVASSKWRTLDEDRTFPACAGLRLDMQNSSQERRRNSAPGGWRNSAPPPPKPRGGPSALAG